MAQSCVRVLVVDVPRLVWDLLEPALARCDDLHLVGRASVDELRDAFRSHRADIALIGLGPEGWPRACDAVMRDRARSHLVGVGWHDGEVWAYRLQPESVPLGPMSPDGVAGYLREAVRA